MQSMLTDAMFFYVSLAKMCMCARTRKNVQCTRDGLDAIVVTADGDMRQAINNLQATHAGCGRVDADSVYRVLTCPSSCVCIKAPFLFVSFFYIRFFLRVGALLFSPIKNE